MNATATNSSFDTFSSSEILTVGSRDYRIYALDAVERAGLGPLVSLPRTLKILLECRILPACRR